MRLFIIMGLGLTMIVTTACQKGGEHRAHIRMGGQGQEKVSARADAINNMLGDSGKCLKVDKLIAAMMSTPNETYLLYTADLNFIEKGESEPLLEVLNGENLLKNSNKSFYLSFNAIGDKCETVSMNNTGSGRPAVFKILSTSNKNTLNLQNVNDPTEKISYEYNRRDHLKITHYLSGGVSCGKGGAFEVKQTYILAYGEAMNHITVSREMMNMFDRKIQLPTEARRAAFDTSRPNMTRVELSYPTYSVIAEKVRQAATQSPICK
jgi:hypothetical protein